MKMGNPNIEIVFSVFLLAIVGGNFNNLGLYKWILPEDTWVSASAEEGENAQPPNQNSTSTDPNDENEGVDDNIRRPIIHITDPSSCSNQVTASGTIQVRGVASDPESGIQKVEAFSHTYPFNNDFPFKMATPISPGNWSHWSIPLELYDTKTRILVRVTNNAGIENWDEILIDIHQTQEKLRAMKAENSVAFVEPSFTYAAYNLDSFYYFYNKYFDTPEGKNITTDLNYMTGDIPADPDRDYFKPLMDSIKEFAPQYDVSIIGDTDVNDGVIFRPDGTNSYDALFLLHNEYVTQKEYDNLRTFVNNGGTIVLLDGNIFYAEVTYDRQYCTATLLKGHDWEFDGKAVHKSVSERYYNETREWAGSNFMINSISDPVTFSNNPYNYSHFEENHVTNPNDLILHDYGLTIGENYESDPSDVDKMIATYELQYGKGKVIGLGVYAQNVASNPQFLEFFDRVVLMHALAPHYDLTLEGTGTSIPIYYLSDLAAVGKVTVENAPLNELAIDLKRLGNDTPGKNNGTDVMWIVLPKKIIDIDPPTEDDSSGLDASANFIITINGNAVPFQHYNVSNERIVGVPVGANDSTIKIHGSRVIPEFPYFSILLINSALFSIVIALFSKGRFKDRKY